MFKKIDFNTVLNIIKEKSEIKELLEENENARLLEHFKKIFYELNKNPDININSFYSIMRKALEIEKKKLPESEE